MNSEAPYQIKLDKNESQHVNVQANIDVSKMEQYIESGGATGINIKIESESDGRKREL